jgi:uncharacterized protein with NRDE domain
MCLISFQWQPNSQQPLVLSANRDEFLNRPAQQLEPWADRQGIYAGKDLSQGGTWLGVHESGRFAALTNHRDMRNKGPENPISRGKLVIDFLTSTLDPLSYLQALESEAQSYAGYNLLVGNLTQLGYYSNRSQQAARLLPPGLYGLSNALLDSPWPKLNKAKSHLASWLELRDSEAINNDSAHLARLLSSTAIAPDEALPDTGIGLAMERVLSSEKILTPNYGTRCSTGLIINQNSLYIEEVTWQPNGEELSTRKHAITL